MTVMFITMFTVSEAWIAPVLLHTISKKVKIKPQSIFALKMSFVYSGEIIPISGCEVSEEFNGVNHKTSHDGLFKVKAIDIRQEILDKIGGIRVTLDGSYVTHGKKNDSNLLC